MPAPARSILVTLTLLLALLPLPLPAQSRCDQQVVRVPVPDPVSGRHYEITVSLPDNPAPRQGHPLILLADGGRAFPRLSCIGRDLARQGAIGGDPVIVGLSYAAGESLEDSRRRDYTPVAVGGGKPAYGGAAAYQTYLKTVVLPLVEAQFGTDPHQRHFWGHSYGGLLGAHILFTDPGLFGTYMLGSPSFWYEDGAIYAFEEAYAAAHRRLDVRVLLYVGGLEVSRYDAVRRGNTRDMIEGMHAFEARLRERGYGGMTMASAVVPGKDHISSVGPGFEWALRSALPQQDGR